MVSKNNWQKSAKRKKKWNEIFKSLLFAVHTSSKRTESDTEKDFNVIVATNPTTWTLSIYLLFLIINSNEMPVSVQIAIIIIVLARAKWLAHRLTTPAHTNVVINWAIVIKRKTLIDPSAHMNPLFSILNGNNARTMTAHWNKSLSSICNTLTHDHKWMNKHETKWKKKSRSQIYFRHFEYSPWLLFVLANSHFV